MKLKKHAGRIIRGVALGLTVLGCATMAKASPYASGLTNIVIGGSNYLQYVMNEAGASVSIVFEDGTSNVLSANMPAGKTNVYIGTNTSWKIYATKLGNGTPFQITTDAHQFNNWYTPRGVDIAKNPTVGSQFGRIFVANSQSGLAPNGGGVRTIGIYALNADCSDSYLGKGTNSAYYGVFSPSGGYYGPWKLSVNPDDNSVDVTDYSTPNAAVWKFDPDFTTTNVILGPVGENQGIAQGSHGDPTGVFTTGSITKGNLVVFTWDPGLGAPATAQLGTGGNGPTQAGNWNNVFRYDIGAGPLPWTNAPVFAVNVCLPTFDDICIGDVSMGPDTNKIYAQCYRANYSDGTIQVFDRTTGNIIYDSLHNGVDDFRPGGSSAPYSQVRVSPDNKFLATIGADEHIYIANLTNGVPDASTLTVINNSPNFGNSRGLAFDAADNLYEVDSGRNVLRGFSLGISSTTITGNDVTGTNGTFQLIVPSTVATVQATTPLASQNYINNGGTPIAGVFTVSLNTNYNLFPVPVQIALTGSAANGVQYTLNSGTDTNGVLIASNLITFPAGYMPGGGNWTALVKITPTATPVSGPSYSLTATLTSGGNYVAGTPKTATLSIQNTGPQLLFVSSTSGNTMNRNIPGDYAKFTLTRWGDTNGPGNTSSPAIPHSYTVTNITYFGTAVFPLDYLANAQRLDSAGNGVATEPANGNPGIVINPGDVAITCVVGQPVAHTNLFVAATNVTIGVSITNTAGGTNGTSLEGYSYSVTTANVSLTEVDNAYGTEVVIWSDSLTNPNDSSWTLTYANTNLAATTVGPVVIPSYTNGASQLNMGGTNDFEVLFGNPVANDNVPASPYMQAQGWTNALRMTVNKDGSFSPCAVNVYPQGLNVVGNVALRFSMYLSLYDGATNNTSQGATGREFALFGIDHNGTNCNWRPNTAPAAGAGSGVTNWDGIWFAVDAGTGSLTPADFDAFNSPAIPNNAANDSDIVSAPTSSETGIFKKPPFTLDSGANGGNPAFQWVDVSLEKFQRSGQNVFTITEYLDRASILSFVNTNASPAGVLPGPNTNGAPMLGYEDPNSNPSDSTAFVYYSNVRIVELAPFLAVSLPSYIVLNGANLSLTNVATYATVAGMTNSWYAGSIDPLGTNIIQTDTSAATSITSVLSLTNISVGNSYFAVASDSAGPITNNTVNVEVVNSPASAVVNGGATATFAVTANGPQNPTAYQWYTNGVALANNTKYAGVTTANLSVSNCVLGDGAVTYTCKVTNPAGNVTTLPASLTVNVTVPSGVVVSPASTNAPWGSPVTFTVSVGAGSPPLVYQWQKNGTNISGATKTSLAFANVVTTNSATYTCAVSNSGGTNSANGVLTVVRSNPTFTGLKQNGTNITASFTSPDTYDKTNAYSVLGSPNVNGPWTNVSGATIVTNGSGFQVTLPESASGNNFYKLQHN